MKLIDTKYFDLSILAGALVAQASYSDAETKVELSASRDVKAIVLGRLVPAVNALLDKVAGLVPGGLADGAIAEAKLLVDAELQKLLAA